MYEQNVVCSLSLLYGWVQGLEIHPYTSQPGLTDPMFNLVLAL